VIARLPPQAVNAADNRLPIRCDAPVARSAGGGTNPLLSRSLFGSDYSLVKAATGRQRIRAYVAIWSRAPCNRMARMAGIPCRASAN